MKLTQSKASLIKAISLVAMAAWTKLLCAGTIAVPNGSFEGPVTAYADPRIDSWQKLPKPDWYDESGGHLWDQLTGVFLNTPAGSADHIDNCDGNQAMFLFALPQVGFFQDYNSVDWTNPMPTHAFNAKFEVGQSYTLTVGVLGGLGVMPEGASLALSLYYRDGASNMVTIAASFITNSPAVFTNTTHLVDFQAVVPVVKTGDAWAGQYIGAQVMSTVNPALVGGYWDLDNIRLSAVAEPADLLSYSRAGSDLRLSWPSATGYQYQIEVSEDLESWSNYDVPLPGTGEELSKLIPTGSPRKACFRLLVTPAR